jgi:quercetin dioxygenase-like cupin family protein
LSNYTLTCPEGGWNDEYFTQRSWVVAARAGDGSRRAAAERGVAVQGLWTDQIPYKGDAKKKGRRFFQGTTHTGFHLEMHETQLGPGEISHPPHKHVNEEVIFLMEGTIEASIEGKVTRANAGSVTYFASNDMHNFKNVGTGTCRYYVLELHGDTA